MLNLVFCLRGIPISRETTKLITQDSKSTNVVNHGHVQSIVKYKLTNNVTIINKTSPLPRLQAGKPCAKKNFIYFLALKLNLSTKKGEEEGDGEHNYNPRLLEG